MTLKQIIDCVDRIAANAFTADEKTGFVNRVELEVQRRILGLRTGKIRRYSYETDKDQPLLLSGCGGMAPYISYVCAMVYLANSDSALYAESNRVFEESIGQIAKRYQRFYCRRDREWIAWNIDSDMLWHIGDALMNGRLVIRRDGGAARLFDGKEEVIRLDSNGGMVIVSPREGAPGYTLTVTGIDCTVTVYAMRGGAMTAIADGDTVYPGERISWSATADPGYALDGESEGCVTVSGDTEICVSASAAVYTLNVTLEHCSAVFFRMVDGVRSTVSPGSVVDFGETVEWTAVADTGYEISPSYGSFTVGDSTPVISATRIQYALTVTENNCTVSACVISGGTPRAVSDGSPIYWGEVIEWSATASSGYAMSDNSGSLTVDGNETVSPATVRLRLLSVIAENCDVSVTGSVSGVVYDGSYVRNGETLSWVASAREGYAMTGQSSGTLTVTDDVEISASASVIPETPPEYTLTVSASHCTVTVTALRDENVTVGSGDTIYGGEYLMWSAVPDEGYQFSGQIGSYQCGSIYVDGDEDLTVSAELIGYTLTINARYCTVSVTAARGGQTVSVANGGTIYYGDVLTWTATADADCSLSESSGSLTVDGDETVSVCATHAPVAIDASGLTNLTVANNVTSAAYGTDCTIYINPASGHVLPDGISVTIGGVPATDGVEYTYTKLQNKLTVAAEYVTGTIAISATGVPGSYTLHINTPHCTTYVSAVRSGLTVSLVDGSAIYYGETLNWTSVADTGYHLDIASGSSTVEGDFTFGFSAQPDQFTLTISVSNCYVSANIVRDGMPKVIPNGGAIYYGEVINWRANAYPGFTVGDNASGRITVDGDETVSVTATALMTAGHSVKYELECAVVPDTSYGADGQIAIKLDSPPQDDTDFYFHAVGGETNLPDTVRAGKIWLWSISADNNAGSVKLGDTTISLDGVSYEDPVVFELTEDGSMTVYAAASDGGDV